MDQRPLWPALDEAKTTYQAGVTVELTVLLKPEQEEAAVLVRCCKGPEETVTYERLAQGLRIQDGHLAAVSMLGTALGTEGMRRDQLDPFPDPPEEF